MMLKATEREALLGHVGAWKYDSKGIARAEYDFFVTVEEIITARLASAEAERDALRQAVDAALPPDPSAVQFNRERQP